VARPYSAASSYGLEVKFISIRGLSGDPGDPGDGSRRILLDRARPGQRFGRGLTHQVTVR